MGPSTLPSRPVRFGVFEVDFEAGLLCKNGQQVKLQEQPLQVLAMLLERPGQIVTREEVQQRLGSADIVVDSDHGLNKAINKIRQALGDSADNPRFVQTLARKGYRFIAPVEQPGNSDLAVDKIRNGSAPSALPAEPKVEKGQRRWTARWTWAAALTALILGAPWWYFHRPPTLPAMTLRRFTSYPGKEKHPALSPDGKRMAFAWDGATGDNFDIYVQSIGPPGELPLTSETPQRLTSDPAEDFSPVWSPDGNHLAFVRHISETTSAIYVMPSMGGEEKKLTELYSIWSEGKSLDWSPDGKFLVTAGKKLSTDPYSLLRISLDAREQRKLTAPAQQLGDIDPN